MFKSLNAFNITACADAPGAYKSRVICRSLLMLLLMFMIFIPVNVGAAELSSVESEESSSVEEASDPIDNNGNEESSLEYSDLTSESESTFESEPGTTVITGGVVLTTEAFQQLLEAHEPSEEVIYDNLDEFLQQPAKVSRFEYEIVKKMEYLQYAIAILIALIFLLIFRVERH